MTSRQFLFALWGIGEDLARGLGEALARSGASEAVLNVGDSHVAGAMLRLTAFDAPVEAVVTLTLAAETAVPGVVDVLTARSGRVAGWQVDVVAPLPPRPTTVGERAEGLANLAFLRKPADLPYEQWLECWRGKHTQVAIDTQATFGYIQNRIVEPVTHDAPEIVAVVEEHFPIEAMHDMHAFYGSGGDDAELTRRVGLMMESIATFGADRDIDVVPTSRYRLI
ncbi:hypothetical protein [Nocardia shimofusensis]|uniref:hypothetical protein n=1 Tax=Nocardia shimofusensis TaxID=228596 RepID=UPI000B07E842|nr:hypothetical protein [Nocardia shimofusensis]